MIGLIIGALLLILLIYGVFIEPHVMKVRHVKIAQKQNLKIAHFTDTHFAWHTTSRRFKKFARNIANEQPDLIIFSGDLFDKVAWAKNRDWTDLLTILSELKAPLGKFAILGNHDFDDCFRELVKLSKLFPSNHFVIWENEYNGDLEQDYKVDANYKLLSNIIGQVKLKNLQSSPLLYDIEMMHKQKLLFNEIEENADFFGAIIRRRLMSPIYIMLN